MATSRNKNFRAHFLFHTKIKTVYHNVLTTTEVKTRVTVAQSSFEAKAKMTNFSPNIFQLFNNFLIYFHALGRMKNVAFLFFYFCQILQIFPFNMVNMTQTIKAKLFVYKTRLNMLFTHTLPVKAEPTTKLRILSNTV